MKTKLYQSFNHAMKGLLHVFETQRNMRFHLIITVLVLIFSFLLQIDRRELILLFLTISLVLIAEMFNTAVESITNMISQSYHPSIRVVKDICAGAVFISVINAVVVGYLIFSRVFSHWEISLNYALSRIKQAPSHLVFITLTLVASLVLVGKLYFRRGTPAQGGLPSGHSAIAFSLWTVITFLSARALVSLLTLILAFLVARSRVRAGIHSPAEVVAGAALGVVITGFLFWLLR